MEGPPWTRGSGFRVSLGGRAGPAGGTVAASGDTLLPVPGIMPASLGQAPRALRLGQGRDSVTFLISGISGWSSGLQDRRVLTRMASHPRPQLLVGGLTVGWAHQVSFYQSGQSACLPWVAGLRFVCPECEEGERVHFLPSLHGQGFGPLPVAPGSAGQQPQRCLRP